MSCWWLTACMLFGIIHSLGAQLLGGTSTWRHIQSNGTTSQVKVYYSLSWIRHNSTYVDGDAEGYYYRHECSEADLLSQRAIPYDGRWEIVIRDSSMDHTYYHYAYIPNDVFCTAHDIFGKWSTGSNSFTVNFDINSNVTAKFYAYRWKEDLFNISGWPALVFATNIDLRARSDTFQVNNPPKTFVPSIVRVQKGCPSEISITSFDDDGDRVTCRYAGIGNTAIGAWDECGSICGNQYSHFTLDEDACALRYDGGGEVIFIPVALMLEDHPVQSIVMDYSLVTPNDIMSQIPLQFVVEIYNDTTACGAQPTLSSYSVPENKIFFISDIDEMLNEVLSAYPSDSSLKIIQFIELGPIGVYVTPAVYDTVTGAYSSNITWEPEINQIGSHKICYYAVDSLGKYSSTSCFTVIVNDTLDPCFFENGGCNDVCTISDENAVCQCSNDCWDLLEDGKTCAPRLNISCDGDNMEISLPLCASQKSVFVGSDSSHFSDPECRSNPTTSDHSIKFSRSQCGLTESANRFLLSYEANTWVWSESGSESSNISRGDWRRIPVTCSLPTAIGIVNGSFIPQHPFADDFLPNNLTIDGVGVYSFYFHFYTSGTYSTAVSPDDYPLEVRVNERMYFSLGAVGPDGLRFFTEKCIASSANPFGVSSLTYTFIEDGCFIDSTLIRHFTESPMEDKLSMLAFEFENRLLSDRDQAEIFIQCQVRLCDASNTSSRCHQGCQNLFRSKSLKRFLEEDYDGNKKGLAISRMITEDEDSSLQTTSARLLLLRGDTTSIDDAGSNAETAKTSLAMIITVHFIFMALQRIV